ncbi:MAG TPA: hypothetical protein VGR29_09560 [Thermomicrobiales bacterium]|nr:hypothetical protein [Thermomicrobiales bacterium]
MTGQRQFSESERMEIEEGIERAFVFVQDVLDDPSVLDQLPERVTIALTPMAEKDASKSYVTETCHFTVSVDQPDSAHRHTHTA